MNSAEFFKNDHAFCVIYKYTLEIQNNEGLYETYLGDNFQLESTTGKLKIIKAENYGARFKITAITLGDIKASKIVKVELCGYEKITTTNSGPMTLSLTAKQGKTSETLSSSQIKQMFNVINSPSNLCQITEINLAADTNGSPLTSQDILKHITLNYNSIGLIIKNDQNISKKINFFLMAKTQSNV